MNYHLKNYKYLINSVIRFIIALYFLTENSQSLDFQAEHKFELDYSRLHNPLYIFDAFEMYLLAWKSVPNNMDIEKNTRAF